MSTDKHLEELGEAVRRAGSIVSENIDAIVRRAERRADEIVRNADSDAEHTRRVAIASAQMLLERIRELERPLAELVDTISRELEGSTESNGSMADREPEALPEPSPEANRADEEQEAGHEEPSPTDPAEATPSVTPTGFPAESTSTSASKGRAGLLYRLRLKGEKAPFISRVGHCAVCHRAFMAGSAESLELSEWRVTGNVGLCPDCQSEDWQLPEDAQLPFRRGS